LKKRHEKATEAEAQKALSEMENSRIAIADFETKHKSIVADKSKHLSALLTLRPRYRAAHRS
jgi:hypothetical protein